jgi:hypothetical protein
MTSLVKHERQIAQHTISLPKLGAHLQQFDNPIDPFDWQLSARVKDRGGQAGVGVGAPSHKLGRRCHLVTARMSHSWREAERQRGRQVERERGKRERGTQAEKKKRG